MQDQQQNQDQNQDQDKHGDQQEGQDKHQRISRKTSNRIKTSNNNNLTQPERKIMRCLNAGATVRPYHARREGGKDKV